MWPRIVSDRALSFTCSPSVSCSSHAEETHRYMDLVAAIHDVHLFLQCSPHTKCHRNFVPRVRIIKEVKKINKPHIKPTKFARFPPSPTLDHLSDGDEADSKVTFKLGCGGSFPPTACQFIHLVAFSWPPSSFWELHTLF